LAKLISGSEIVILNVIDNIKTPPVIFDKKVRNYKTREATTLSNYLRDLQKHRRHKMINRLDELKNKYQNSVQIRTLVSIGRPKDKILEYANKQHVDIIVMGNRGVKGISRFLMGSVSRTVSEGAKCTVMIVK
jgi:nucleotide-binding universal stress UspA family protein